MWLVTVATLDIMAVVERKFERSGLLVRCALHLISPGRSFWDRWDPRSIFHPALAEMILVNGLDSVEVLVKLNQLVEQLGRQRIGST
jgi:hypothetical protein